MEKIRDVESEDFSSDFRLLVAKIRRESRSDSLDKIWKSIKNLNFIRKERYFIGFLIIITIQYN